MNKFDGVKGFRKANLKKPTYFVGKQNVRLKAEVAINLLNDLKKIGFNFYGCEYELASKGLLDLIVIDLN